MADEVGVVTQDEAGHWYCDGERCVCSLGGHEGKARARALGRRFAALVGRLSPGERERVLERARASFDTLDELMPWPFPAVGKQSPC